MFFLFFLIEFDPLHSTPNFIRFSNLGCDNTEYGAFYGSDNFLLEFEETTTTVRPMSQMHEGSMIEDEEESPSAKDNKFRCHF